MFRRIVLCDRKPIKLIAQIYTQKTFMIHKNLLRFRVCSIVIVLLQTVNVKRTLLLYE